MKKKKSIDSSIYDWDDREIDTGADLSRMSEDEIAERYERIFDKPYEKGRRQKVQIRAITSKYERKYGLLDNLTDYTVILYSTSNCEAELMVRTAGELLERGCCDFARCCIQEDEWKCVLLKKFSELYGDPEKELRIWTIGPAEEIEDSLWICKDNILVMCYDEGTVKDFCGKMRNSLDFFAYLERKMGITWGYRCLVYDRMIAWQGEADYEGDPFPKTVSLEEFDYLEDHVDEWWEYQKESRQKELDLHWKKIKVLGTYCVGRKEYLICEKFPDSIIRMYLHTGNQAYMKRDSMRCHGFMVYQNEPVEVFQEIREHNSFPEEFTLVTLKAREDLSGIKNIYFSGA